MLIYADIPRLQYKTSSAVKHGSLQQPQPLLPSPSRSPTLGSAGTWAVLPFQWYLANPIKLWIVFRKDYAVSIHTAADFRMTSQSFRLCTVSNLLPSGHLMSLNLPKSYQTQHLGHTLHNMEVALPKVEIHSRPWWQRIGGSSHVSPRLHLHYDHPVGVWSASISQY